MSVRKTFRLPKALATQLSEAAANRGVDLSTFVREILLARLKAKPELPKVRLDTDVAEHSTDVVLRFIDTLLCEYAWLEVHYDLLHDEMARQTRQLSDRLDQIGELDEEHRQEGMASVRLLADSLRMEIAHATRGCPTPFSAAEQRLVEAFHRRMDARDAAGEPAFNGGQRLA